MYSLDGKPVGFSYGLTVTNVTDRPIDKNVIYDFLTAGALQMKVQTAVLRQAYKELNTPKPPSYQLTPAEYKRRLVLIAHEKGQQPQPDPINKNQKDLFA
jgi:hypothetical protein